MLEGFEPEVAFASPNTIWSPSMRTTAPAQSNACAEPLVYPPLSEEVKTRMRLAGWGDLLPVLDGVEEDAVQGLLEAARSGPVFTPAFVRSGALTPNMLDCSVHRLVDLRLTARRMRVRAQILSA